MEKLQKLVTKYFYHDNLKESTLSNSTHSKTLFFSYLTN